MNQVEKFFVWLTLLVAGPLLLAQVVKWLGYYDRFM